MTFLIKLCILTLLLQDYTSVGTQDYIVDTHKCKIPNYPPFTEESLPFYRPEIDQPCSNKPPLSSVQIKNNIAYLKINPDLFPIYGENVKCCYSAIERNQSNTLRPDDSISKSKCLEFTKSAKIGNHIHTVMVQCTNAISATVYENVHNTFVISEDVTRRISKMPKTAKPISVLFIVVDSVSRLNLIRTMSKTRNYLLDNNFVELKGYNKIDDNTYPNFMALLTGFNLKESNKRCSGKIPGNLDRCPMIWHKYRNLGYATAYGEDYGSITTFNYLKYGFTKQPTDYYSRAYVLASEMLPTLLRYGGPYCAGPKTSGERQLDLAKDFVKNFKGKPYFGIFWMNTFSHNAMNLPTLFDEKLYTFFAELKAENVLKESVVIFLSDHGIRSVPDFRKTRVGWIEERLPFHLISMPKWLQQKFPKEYQNLRSNSDKLTSTYDLYMTLQHILELSGLNYTAEPAKACYGCKSLFKEVGDRSCEEAGISQEWCSCLGYLELRNSSDPLISKAIDFVIEDFNSKLIEFGVQDKCVNHTVDYAYAGVSNYPDFRNKKYVFLNIKTKPNAEYMLLLEYNVHDKDFRFKRTSSILRLNNFNEYDTGCIQNKYAKKYCYCRWSGYLNQYGNNNYLDND